MYKLTVTCKGSKSLIGEFIGWSQLEQLIAIQSHSGLWNWFNDMFYRNYHRLLDLPSEHYVTQASNGMVVTYSVEAVEE